MRSPWEARRRASTARVWTRATSRLRAASRGGSRFGRRPLPHGVDLELRTGLLAEELRALADEGVQSLLLEGGPTLATAFFEADLIDKVLLFVAPRLVGVGPGFVAALPSARTLSRLAATRVGDDVLLEAYVHEP